jgi:hypothetical protein
MRRLWLTPRPFLLLPPTALAQGLASGTVNTVSAFGSGVNENLFLIDGTNFTCPCQGVSPNFNRPTVFIDPRRAMLGVRVNLGR